MATNRTNGTTHTKLEQLFLPRNCETELASTMSSSVTEHDPPSVHWLELVAELPLFPPDGHPPPNLFPLLSPLLQQKLGLLSLGRGRGWPGTLTWLPPDLSYRVNERLKSAWRADGLGERLRGYRRFDAETVHL
jgi:hypothetical protein